MINPAPETPVKVPDWSLWQPTERAVLCFIVQGGRILLIEKKRGLGAGKINGPGGRIEKGETPLQAACRETEEEVGLIPQDMVEAGRLCFQFTDGYALHCTVFRAGSFRGNPVETDEAKPFWENTASIPYEKMWADDIFWMHHLLNNTYFEGFFVFENDRLLDHKLHTPCRA